MSELKKDRDPRCQEKGLGVNSEVSGMDVQEAWVWSRDGVGDIVVATESIYTL